MSIDCCLRFLRAFGIALLGVTYLAECSTLAAEVDANVGPFLTKYCADCHSGETPEAGFSISTLARTLSDDAQFARWERIFDRTDSGEMPPAGSLRPGQAETDQFLKTLKPALVEAHSVSKATVLRRLNRQEYENTLNDVFGVAQDLASLLPEDSRSGEFDTVGESLGISMVHLERYLEAARMVLDEAIAKQSEQPTVETKVGSYIGTSEGDKFIGQRWLKLSDDAVVRFSGGGYPSGMMRTANVSTRGRYRVRVEGYAYQSDSPITFSVGATTFKRGAETPTFGYFSFAPGSPAMKPQVVELEAVIDGNYMIQIEPYGINDPQRYKRESIDGYAGPGLAIVRVTLDGPLVDEFPSRGHRLVFDGFERTEIPPRNPRDRTRRGYRPSFEVTAVNEMAAVRASLLRLAKELYRRPVGTADVRPFETLYQTDRESGASIEEALRTAIAAIMTSPRFLYFDEQPGRLDDHAIATRLSYFLHRTSPDDRLSRIADDGKLAGNNAELAREVKRLIGEPHFDRFVSDFADSWLDLRELDFTTPDRQLFPEFDDYLRWSMPLETRAFVRELIANNRPIRDLVDPDFAMVNSRLAELYEIPGVDGADVRKVPVAGDSLRGGLLAHAAIHKVTANGTNTSPVVRGAWVMERIVGEPPQPPPPGIPGVEPDIRGAQTLRELLDKHRSQADCNACHRKIDPPGFALESFNPIGGYRDRYRSLGDGDRVDTTVDGNRVRYRLGPAVDASGTTPDDQPFADFAAYRELLASDEARLAKTLTTKLLTFAVGREMGFSDRDEIDRVVKSVAADGYRVGDILEAVALSSIFQTK